MSRVLRYPDNVSRFNKWLRFDVRKGRHVGRQGAAEGAQRDDVVIAAALYLPTSALSSSMRVDYDTTEFSGMMMEMAANAIDKLAGMKVGQNALESSQAAASAAWNDLSSTVTNLDAGTMGEFAKRALLQGPLSQYTSQIEALAGQRVNPRTDILFTSQQYRTWTFEYVLIPRTLQEAREIENIVNMFRFYMLPSYQTANPALGPKAAYMMGYPYEWTINIFGSGRDSQGVDAFGPLDLPTNAQAGGNVEPPQYNALKHANRIGRSVLRNLAVDQAGGGKVAFVAENGSQELFPLVTSMTLEFQEVMLLGRDQRYMVGTEDETLFPDPRAR